MLQEAANFKLRHYHRFARAHFFLQQGREEAAKLGIACEWRLVVVPGVAHEGMRMAASAAQHWCA